MEIREAIYRRQSIRAFTPEPVSKKTLLQLLDAAIQAPSARNMQPWHFIVVTGKARERLVQRLTSRYEEELAQGIQPPAMELAEPYQTRVRRFMEALQPFAVREPHFDLMRGSLNFYGAPAVILLALDRSLPLDRLFDLGAAVQNLLLLAPIPGSGHLRHRHRAALPGFDQGRTAIAGERQPGDDRGGGCSGPGQSFDCL